MGLVSAITTTDRLQLFRVLIGCGGRFKVVERNFTWGANHPVINRSTPNNDCERIPGASPGELGPDGDRVTCWEHSYVHHGTQR